MRQLFPPETASAGETYRLGNGDFYLTVPAGMEVRFDRVILAGGEATVVFVDTATGSELWIGGQGTEVRRVIRVGPDGPGDIEVRLNQLAAAIGRSR